MIRFVSQKYGRGNLPMHSGEMLETLGLKAGGHLPIEGMPERVIQGVRVWVTPAPARRDPESLPKFGPSVRTSGKSSTHRVMCECPTCGAVLSAGRLFQHRCKLT